MFISNLLHLFRYRNNSMVWPSSGSTCHTKVIYSHNITMSLVKYNLKSTTFVYTINSVAGKIYTWFVCEVCIQTSLLTAFFLNYCVLLWTWVFKVRSYVCFWRCLETMLNQEFRISIHKKRDQVIGLGGGLNRMEGWFDCILQHPSHWLQ
jgi:hypothetical protein